MTIREPRPLNEYEQWELLKQHEKVIEEIQQANIKNKMP